ncbi:MAG: nucleotidyl transferase AbiEii/AbiGii toxin family protein [Planctomycetota bacterium]|jgi:predicted nucleotidyltransferase component of viral defense system
MHEAVRQMLSKYTCITKDDYVNALREILQEIALLGLWRSKFFEHAAFYGGTALRILYGLDRFSEDLDFSLLKPDPDFSLNSFSKALQKEITSFGFTVEYENKEKEVQTNIESAFLKANTTQQLITIEANNDIVEKIHSNEKLKIKLEVDTDPPAGFEVENKYLLAPIPFSVNTFSLPDLFAGKLHAVLCRKWKNRVKGRDWYDMIWYAAYHPQVRLSHLQKRMLQSGHRNKENQLTMSELIARLTESIENLDIDQARQEVSLFVKDQQSLEVWSKDFFLAVIQKVQPVAEDIK